MFKNKLVRLQQEFSFFLNEKVSSNCVVIFLVPGEDAISGGLMSIVKLYRLVKKEETQLGLNCFICTHPFDNNLKSYTRHNSDVIIYNFTQIFGHLKESSRVLLQVSESHVVKVSKQIGGSRIQDVLKQKDIILDINILNQNPNFFPSNEDLLKFVISQYKKITITTAHVKYNQNLELGDFTIESSYLGTPVGPDVMKKVLFDNKKNILLVSHDPHPRREEILKYIGDRLPNLEIIIVKDISFEEYTELQKKSKWTLTLGEGYDAYFARGYMYGGITFAIFNEEFFPSEFKNFRTAYSSEEVLIDDICNCINEMDCESLYTGYNEEVRNELSKYYNYQEYVGRVRNFHINWAKTCRFNKKLS